MPEPAPPPAPEPLEVPEPAPEPEPVAEPAPVPKPKPPPEPTCAELDERTCAVTQGCEWHTVEGCLEQEKPKTLGD